jgi:hypothetical protein
VVLHALIAAGPAVAAAAADSGQSLRRTFLSVLPFMWLSGLPAAPPCGGR